MSKGLRSQLEVIMGFSDVLADKARCDLVKPYRAKILEIRKDASPMGALIDPMLRLSHVIHREVERVLVDLTAMAVSAMPAKMQMDA